MAGETGWSGKKLGSVCSSNRLCTEQAEDGQASHDYGRWSQGSHMGETLENLGTGTLELTSLGVSSAKEGYHCIVCLHSQNVPFCPVSAPTIHGLSHFSHPDVDPKKRQNDDKWVAMSALFTSSSTATSSFLLVAEGWEGCDPSAAR